MFLVEDCFGGKYVLKLAASEDITAGALAHGTLVTVEDIKAVKKPVSFACIEDDGFFPDDVRVAGEKHLQEMGIEHEMKVYSKVPHGMTSNNLSDLNLYDIWCRNLEKKIYLANERLQWENLGFAVYGSYEDKHIKDSQKAANEQMLAWLKSHES